jgi:hypothetical protein
VKGRGVSSDAFSLSGFVILMSQKKTKAKSWSVKRLGRQKGI